METQEAGAVGTEVEIYIFWTSIALIGIGIIGAFVHYKVGKDHWTFEVTHYLGLLGLILLPAVFAVSAALGRLEAFLTVLRDNPTRLLESFQSGRSISDACVNGICSKYCCESSNGAIKWRDCVEDCSSRVGAIGVRTGDDCAYDMEREAVCKLTGQGGKNTIIYQAGLCNHLPSAGPVTCYCCVGPEDDKWWDCDADCSGAPELNGQAVNVNTCLGSGTDSVHRVECKNVQEDHDDITVIEGNSQTF
jgi:hypothetical protein